MTAISKVLDKSFVHAAKQLATYVMNDKGEAESYEEWCRDEGLNPRVIHRGHAYGLAWSISKYKRGEKPAKKGKRRVRRAKSSR